MIKIQQIIILMIVNKLMTTRKEKTTIIPIIIETMVEIKQKHMKQYELNNYVTCDATSIVKKDTIIS